VAVRIPEPGSQTSRQILIWEPHPWWVPRLQHRFAGSDVGVRSFQGLLASNDSSPEVMIFDTSGDAGTAARGIAEIRQRSGGVFVIVVVPHDLHSAEWRLRDLGADVVVADDISGDELTRICRHALRTGQHSSESI
jgi:DNA-binding NarL/FixJ family response regulator